MLSPGAPIPAPGSLGRSLATQSCTPLAKEGGEVALKTMIPCKSVAFAVQLPLRTYTRKEEKGEGRGRERERKGREGRGRGREREKRGEERGRGKRERKEREGEKEEGGERERVGSPRN